MKGMGKMRKPWLIVALAGLVWFVPFSAALAHEENEKVPARTLVQQAIALLGGQPDQVEAIEEKIRGALEADNAEGVDLALVKEAYTAFQGGDPHRARDLLEESIGLKPHQVVVSPKAELRATATPEGSAEAAPALHEAGVGGGLRAPRGLAGPMLLGLAGAMALLGVVVLRRERRWSTR